MSNRVFTAGLVCLVLVLGSLLAVRWAGPSPEPPMVAAANPPAPPDPPATSDGFVELRFRLPRGGALPAPAPTTQQGALVRTDEQLDLAIEGPGFFQVMVPSGELRYTRAGVFRLNAQGNLVTAGGFLLCPQISVPVNAISVSVGCDGTVSSQNPGALNAATVLGQLTLVRFVNPAGLEKTPERLLREMEGSGPPIIGMPGDNGLGRIKQGFREQHHDELVRRVLTLLQQLAEDEGAPAVVVRQGP